MQTLRVSISRDTDGSYIAQADKAVEEQYKVGLYGVGATPKVALQELQGVIEDMKSAGVELPDFDLHVSYDAPTLLNVYGDYFTLAGLQRITGINQRQLWHYKSGTRRPSAATADKIISSVRGFGKQLSYIV